MRKTCLCRALLALSFAWMAYTQTGSGPAPMAIQKLKEDLYLIEGTSNGSGDAGNVTVYLTNEGVILVDDRFDRDYRDIVAKVHAVTAQPIKYIINTHHHGDHTGSNASFLGSAEVVIQANARRHMADTKMPGPPRIVFTKEASVFLGGKEVRAIYCGRGHTDGDIAVYIPAHRAVALGDLLAGTNGVTNPVVDYSSGGSIDAWPATLDQVLQLDLETVIPGHGAVTTKAVLRAHRDKVAAVRDRVRGMVSERKSKEEISQAMISQFDFKPINMRGLDGMMAELRR
jgi:glyoxylase-like metal-dependent hydrolase (beta-lactamase superfamily II)